jgi:hypothetical protein
LGIDVRPATRQLYALGSTSRLYTLNPSTGVATAVGAPFTPALDGFSFGFDFNPVIDRIRVVSDTNKNLVLDPNTGAVQLVATDLHYVDFLAGVDPNVVDSAYSNNQPGALTTQLYGVESRFGHIVTQANNTGELAVAFDIGGFGKGNSLGGFDVSGATGVAYMALQIIQESVSRLYLFDLATGNKSGGDVIGGGLVITALTAAFIPEPSTASLFVSALIGPTIFRHRRHVRTIARRAG